MVAVSWIVAIYYNVVISHVMLYLFASFASITTKLPWVDCDNWWNTPACLAHDYDKKSVEEIVEASVNGQGDNVTYEDGMTTIAGKSISILD